MKLTGLFKRGAACLCTAAILMGGISAFALSPALPDEPAPADPGLRSERQTAPFP